MLLPAFQEEFAELGIHQCWGCGSRNEHGLQIKSYWDGENGICTWQPHPYHTSWPGRLNGGILATIMDCHSVCTAMAAAYRAENRGITTPPIIKCVTGSLHLTYLHPTPMTELLLRASVREANQRKILVTCTLTAGGQVCVQAEVIVVRLPAPPAGSGFLEVGLHLE
jgi:acyl-coenzyme A thioesterase PaaI-like protein